jgi:aryl-alcohol dehydrogenase-like predicted oxidoreductase
MPQPPLTGRAFTHATLPSLGKEVGRLGLAGNYGISTADAEYAATRGIDYWCWSPNYKKVTPVLRELFQTERDKHVVAMLGIALTAGMVRRGVDKALRLLGTDYLDVYQLSWLSRMSRLSPAIQDTCLALRDEGKIRSIGVSIHDRVRAGKLAVDSVLDMFMIRYNAAHPGAEQDIFPHLGHRDPTVVAYTATSWRQLLKPLKGLEMPPFPGDDRGATIPPLTPSLCYRFVLSRPEVHVVLTGPANRDQLDENLAVLEQGALSEEEDAWVRDYGKLVRARKKIPFM